MKKLFLILAVLFTVIFTSCSSLSLVSDKDINTNDGYLSRIYLNKDCVGGLTTFFTYTNLNEKTVKYITITYYFTNGVGDKCKDEITGHYNFAKKCVGPIYYKKSARYGNTMNPDAYNTTAKYLYISKVKIEYMDGSISVLEGKNIIII